MRVVTKTREDKKEKLSKEILNIAPADKVRMKVSLGVSIIQFSSNFFPIQILVEEKSVSIEVGKPFMLVIQ